MILLKGIEVDHVNDRLKVVMLMLRICPINYGTRADEKRNVRAWWKGRKFNNFHYTRPCRHRVE